MRIVSVVFAAILLMFGAFSAQAGEKEARAYVNKISTSVIDIISNTGLETAEKEKKLVSLFEQSVDTKWIGRFVLGRYYTAATPEQKKRYDDVYRDFLIRSYVPKFKEYKGETFEMNEVRKDGKDEYMVKTNIVSPNEPSIRVDYRIRETGGSYRIIDIISEGVSLITTQRSEFGSVVSREGMDYLLDRLTARVEQMKSGN